MSGFWVRERPRGTHGSPGPRAERGDALCGGCCAGGGPTRRGSPACGIPALGRAYGPSNLTLKNKRGSGVLTGGSERAVYSCSDAGVEAGRRSGRGRSRGSPGSGTPWIDSVEACGSAAGSGRLDRHRRQGKRVGGASYRRGSRVENSGRGTGGFEASGLGAFPGDTAESKRCLPGTQAWRSGVTVVAWGSAPLGARRAATRVCGWMRWRGRSLGGVAGCYL